MPEYWDVYDINRKPLGKLHDRAKYDTDPLLEGEFHIVVNILAVNKDGKILTTKRHPDKTFGGYWEISGGSVLAGETSLNGAVRELSEETGLKADPDELMFMGTIIRRGSNCIHDFYLYQGDFDERDITLQEGETVDFKLLTPDELYQMAKSGEFLDFVYDRINAMFSDVFWKQFRVL